MTSGHAGWIVPRKKGERKTDVDMLTLEREEHQIAVFSNIHTKNINTICGKMQSYWMLDYVVHAVKTVLFKELLGVPAVWYDVTYYYANHSKCDGFLRVFASV
jgi:hypothetical protein